MADLTFDELRDKLPANSISATADDVTISLKTVMGEAAIQLTDAKVAEALSKLLSAASQAQTDYNAANSSSQLSAYPASRNSVPVADGNGGHYITRTHFVTVRIPLDASEISAATV